MPRAKNCSATCCSRVNDSDATCGTLTTPSFTGLEATALPPDPAVEPCRKSYLSFASDPSIDCSRISQRQHRCCWLMHAT